MFHFKGESVREFAFVRADQGCYTLALSKRTDLGEKIPVGCYWEGQKQKQKCSLLIRTCLFHFGSFNMLYGGSNLNFAQVDFDIADAR